MQAARLEGYIYLVGFALCIPAANWLLGHAGTVCPPNSPCLIPVAPSIMAPSGVPMIGLALVLRDLVQRRLGARWAIGAILAGAALSALLAILETEAVLPFDFENPLWKLVVASGVAFLFSEIADFAVYTPLQRKQLVLAVVASGLVGLVIDSVLFLQLAFGNLDFLAGQIIGKAWVVLLSIPIIWWLRTWDQRRGVSAV